MTWTGAITVSCSLLLLFFLFILWRVKSVNVLEKLSIFSFRLAFAFLLLFMFNVLGGVIGFEIPINFFSAFIIALLGVPGVCSVGIINYFL